MQLRDILDDFGSPQILRPAMGVPIDQGADIEAEKLESFEEGYRAGWDDAVKAQSDDRSRISSDFAQNLQDLSFTYHEAYSHVLNAVMPLLEEMVNVLLPQMAREAIGAHIVEQLQSRAQEIGTLDVVVAVAPSNSGAVEPLLEQDFGFPLKLETDDTLAEGQADIRFGEIEQQIDLSDVLTSVSDAVHGFAHENRRTLAHG